MLNDRIKLLTATACSLILSLSTIGQPKEDGGATLGDPAPELKDLIWIQGEPVRQFEPGHFYVIEFWATWCGPCRQSIPHLNRLHQMFSSRKVVFIGISTENPAVVRQFVRKMGQDMTYPVACDVNRVNWRAYMESYGQKGIPCAFVVDTQRRVVWIGHPMEELDQVLESLINGTYDLEKQKHLFEYVRLARRAGTQAARPIGENLIKLAQADPAILAKLALYAIAAPPSSKADPELAQRAITLAAGQATGQTKALVEAVRGVILFEEGRKEEALQLERQALRMAKESQASEGLISRIELWINAMETMIKAQNASSQ